MFRSKMVAILYVQHNTDENMRDNLTYSIDKKKKNIGWGILCDRRVDISTMEHTFELLYTRETGVNQVNCRTRRKFSPKK